MLKELNIITWIVILNSHTVTSGDATKTYLYDANGNFIKQTGERTVDYSYDKENHLVKATIQKGNSVIIESYTYNYVGNSSDPSWVEGEEPKEGENGKQYAKRMMDEKYGNGNWLREGKQGREYSKLKKYGDRARYWEK